VEVLFWVTAFFASLFGTIAAFGISSILLPVALTTFNYYTAIILVSLFHISGNLGRISFYKSGIDKFIVLYFGIPAIIFSFVGANFIGFVDVVYLRILVGLILILYSTLNLLDYKISFDPNIHNIILGGSAYGFLSGFIGTGGPVRGAMLTSFDLKGERYIATSGIVSLFIDLTRISVYVSKGFLDSEYYWYVPFLLLVALSGSLTSKLIVKKWSVSRFSKFVHLGILIVNIKLVYDGVFSILTQAPL
jgi:uncharacterized membrane protein YfcA